MVSCHFQRSICDPLKVITITIALLRRCHSIINNIPPPSLNTNNLSNSQQGWWYCYCWTQVKKFFVVEICFSFLLKVKCSSLPPSRDLLKVIISCSLGYFNKTVNFCWLMLLVMKCFEFSIKRVLPVRAILYSVIAWQARVNTGTLPRAFNGRNSKHCR